MPISFKVCALPERDVYAPAPQPLYDGDQGAYAPFIATTIGVIPAIAEQPM
jgi:hypothetical protein